MKLSLRPGAGLLSAAFVASATLAHGHPGHDDGHELTWDFAHLAQHPWATLACLATIGVGVAVVVQVLQAKRRQETPRDHSFRGSQRSRGK